MSDKSADMQRKSSGKNIEGIKPYNFKPGQSGNPKGRPKNKTLSEMIREVLMEEIPVKSKNGESRKELGIRLLAEAWFRKANKGDMSAIKEILDRTEGKVTDKRHITGEVDVNGGSKAIESMKEKLDSLADRLGGGKE